MSTSKMLRRSFALLGLLLVTSVPATAQRRNGADEGEYQILQARYGTAENNVDVTQQLKELARQDRRFKLVNDLFNVDPAPGQRKTLRIYARGRDGQSRTFDYTEYSDVDGNQFTGWGSGNWGPERNDNSWDDGRAGRNGDGMDAGEFLIEQARYGTAERNVDVTQRLKELARQDRRFKLVNELFNVDPASGQRKTLRIYARGRDGQSRTFDYTEYSDVDGSQFTGWGSGNWGPDRNDNRWDDGRAGRGGDGRDAGEFQVQQARYGTSERNVDVTKRVRELVRADQRFVVNNITLGVDPHPRKRKFLRIQARDRDGNSRDFDFPEDSTVEGSQFTARRRGN